MFAGKKCQSKDILNTYLGFSAGEQKITSIPQTIKNDIRFTSRHTARL